MGAYRDQHGQWRYRKRIRLLDGQYVRVRGTPSLNTKASAEQTERAHIERALRGALGPNAKPKEVLTLSKFIEEIWWPKYRLGGGRRGVSSATTVMEKEYHMRVHILPGLGQWRLNQITNERVTGFFGALREKGYQKKGRRTQSVTTRQSKSGKRGRGAGRIVAWPGSVWRKGPSRNIRTTLHTILVFAIKWDYLDRMPELPDVVVPEASFDWYRPHEAAALVAAARDAWEQAVLLFPLHTGARMGEQRAIRWTDIDFDLRRVCIRQSAPKWRFLFGQFVTAAHSCSATTTARSWRRGSSTRCCGRRRNAPAFDASSGTSCGTRTHPSWRRAGCRCSCYEVCSVINPRGC